MRESISVKWAKISFSNAKISFKDVLTQCANIKDHFVYIKITDFDDFFREAWDGLWVHPESKNFGPGPLTWAQGLVLGTKNGQNGHFLLQKNHPFCNLWTISR